MKAIYRAVTLSDHYRARRLAAKAARLDAECARALFDSALDSIRLAGASGDDTLARISKARFIELYGERALRELLPSED